MNILKIKTPKRRVGDIGERAAARYLRLRGYKILRRNLVFEKYEIDIVAKKKTEIIFVEVKTRSLETLGEYDPLPRSEVDREKMRRIIFEASQSLGLIKYLDKEPSYRARLDVIEVYLEGGRPKKIEHLIAAFNKNDARARRY